uniref:Exocyst complex component Sec6 n=1 Tax=Pundamilia nyererei TaxID=303518 RepID=A0A3B4GKV0_9CICH
MRHRNMRRGKMRRKQRTRNQASFCEATQQLIDSEKHLFWETAEGNKEAVEKLAADHKALEEHVWHILQQSFSLSSEEASASALKSAVKAINLEEEQDQLWKQNSQIPPAWRPSEWKKHHDKVLHELVNGRMDNPSSPTGDQVNPSTIQATIQFMGKQLKDDLQRVVEKVNNCYPPEMDICNFYARQYHQTVKARLRKIVGSVGSVDDCSFLLLWVKESYPEDFFEKHDLFPENVRENCLPVLTEMKQSAHTYLLTSVRKVLKELIGRLQQEVTVEYVQRLLKGEVKLKDSNQQQKAYETVQENGERLHELFGSKQDWLKEILTKIAEVLKLQDIPAIQMQIVSLGSAYPDLSEKHLSALLKLKANLSKVDKKTIKTTVLDILKESHTNAETRAFFSKVEVTGS